MADDDHWLLLLSDPESILLEEVLGDTDLLAITHVEEGVAWAEIELDVLDDVGSLVAVVRNDAVVSELVPASLLEGLEEVVFVALRVAIFKHLIIDLINPVQDSLG